LGLATYRKSVSETKHAAILEAARANFLRDGYSRAAMAEIAREADVSTATLYKHFASKEMLFAAVVQEAYTGTEATILTDTPGKPARTVLHNIALVCARLQFDEQMNDLLRVVIAEVPSAPHLAREVYENGVLERYRQIQTAVDLLVARGELKPHDTQVSALYLAGMVKEFVVWPSLFTLDFKRSEDMDSKLEACIDAYLGIYAARPLQRDRIQGNTRGT